MSIFVSGALVLAKQHFTTVKKSCKIMYFQELFIWLAPEHQLQQLIDAPEHQFWSRCFMSMFISGALVLTKQHFTTVKKSLQKHVFSRIVHLAGTGALVLGSSPHYYFHNLWLCLKPRDFGFILKIGKACIPPVKLVFLRS